MEAFPRQTLLTAAELMDVAIRRMERITRSLRGNPLDKLEAAGVPGDIRQLKKDYLSLDDALHFVLGNACLWRLIWKKGKKIILLRRQDPVIFFVTLFTVWGKCMKIN